MGESSSTLGVCDMTCLLLLSAPFRDSTAKYRVLLVPSMAWQMVVMPGENGGHGTKCGCVEGLLLRPWSRSSERGRRRR
ncbi:Uncharacterised protein [Mycobacteroides abscessus subsp. abscessus]|nr:Uncharacterised protein [Mycobacteroides abscessus subsp. abscessus]